MRHLFLYFVLVYAAMAAETTLPFLPKQERYFDKAGWVYIIVRDLTTLVYTSPGCWECKTWMTKMSQEDYLMLIVEQAPLSDKSRLVAQLGRYWVGPDEPWKALNLTEEQYKDWLLTGALKSPEELAAIKAYVPSRGNLLTPEELIAAKAKEEEKQVASAMAEISQIQYYINPGTGVWHVDPNCPDNVGCITVSPFDVLKYENRKQCTKCGVK